MAECGLPCAAIFGTPAAAAAPALPSAITELDRLPSPVAFFEQFVLVRTPSLIAPRRPPHRPSRCPPRRPPRRPLVLGLQHTHALCPHALCLNAPLPTRPFAHTPSARTPTTSASDTVCAQPSRPVVFRGAADASSWPPLAAFPDFSYLRTRCGHRRVCVKSLAVHDADGRPVFVSDPVRKPSHHTIPYQSIYQSITKPPISCHPVPSHPIPLPSHLISGAQAAVSRLPRGCRGV
jgi:hypothetical protein